MQEPGAQVPELFEGEGQLSVTGVPWISAMAGKRKGEKVSGPTGDAGGDDGDPIEDDVSGDGGEHRDDRGGDRGDEGEGGSGGKGSREDARGRATSFQTYKVYRKFLFIHHFSGASDRLPNAVASLAKARDLQVEVISVDRDSGGEDLTADEPYGEHLQWARSGLVDGYHSGFPCTTFSRVRWRKADHLPGPVRSKAYPHGLPSNTVEQQREADQGTVMMVRSLGMARALREVGNGRKVGPSYTVENPPASDHPQHLSAWETEDMVAFCDSADIQEANFDSCIYEQKVLRDGKRHLKPQKFAGKLERLHTLFGRCTCESGVHEPVVGKKATAASAMYSSELRVAYAMRLVAHFEKMAEAEFLEDKIHALREEIAAGQGVEGKHRHVKKKLRKLKEDDLFQDVAEAEHLERLRKRLRPGGDEAAASSSSAPAGSSSAPAARSAEDGIRREPETEGSEGTKAKSKATPGKVEPMHQLWQHAGEEGDTDPNVSWKGGPGKYGMLKRSAAVEEQAVSQVYLGGMRHPGRVVRDMPGALNVGLRVRAVWERLVRKAPALLRAAEDYGTEDCELDGALLEEWKSELKKVLGARQGPAVRLQLKGQYRSKVDPEILEAWARRTGDPETAVPEWLRHGAPLGIEKEIETCGVFPPSKEVLKGGSDLRDGYAQALRGGLVNYKTVEDNKELAKEELDRLVAAGFAVRCKVEDTEVKTMSKLGLILKEKEDGGELVKFVALLFGFKTAPLPYGRLGAMVARFPPGLHGPDQGPPSGLPGRQSVGPPGHAVGAEPGAGVRALHDGGDGAQGGVQER